MAEQKVSDANRRLGGPRGRFRPFGEGNKNIPLLRKEPQFLGRLSHASYCGNINQFDCGRSVVVTYASGKD
jgi:hypothetical protein